jgi:hypothetical protein
MGPGPPKRQTPHRALLDHRPRPCRQGPAAGRIGPCAAALQRISAWKWQRPRTEATGSPDRRASDRHHEAWPACRRLSCCPRRSPSSSPSSRHRGARRARCAPERRPRSPIGTREAPDSWQPQAPCQGGRWPKVLFRPFWETSMTCARPLSPGIGLNRAPVVLAVEWVRAERWWCTSVSLVQNSGQRCVLLG